MQEDKITFDNKARGRRRSERSRQTVMPLSPFQFGANGMNFNAEALNELIYSDTDPNGSYTGITKDGDNRPVQDADDL